MTRLSSAARLAFMLMTLGISSSGLAQSQEATPTLQLPPGIPELPAVPFTPPQVDNIDQLQELVPSEGKLKEMFFGQGADQAPVSVLRTPDIELDQVSVEQCWIRAMPLPQLEVGMYFQINNQGNMTINLTAVKSEEFGRASLHQIVMGDNAARTLPIESVPIAPGATQVFSPEQLLVVLAEPRKPVEVGQKIAMRFLFGGDGYVDHACQVQPSKAMGFEAPAP